MALSIKNPEADRLARELAAITGETLTDAVTNSLRERLKREKGKEYPVSLRQELREIRERCAELPVRDARQPDEIVGYDANGVPD